MDAPLPAQRSWGKGRIWIPIGIGAACLALALGSWQLAGFLLMAALFFAAFGPAESAIGLPWWRSDEGGGDGDSGGDGGGDGGAGDGGGDGGSGE